MTGDWRRLSLAALAATALAFASVSQVEAQAPAKSAGQKASPKGPNAEDGEAEKAPAKKKRQDPAEAQRAIDAAVKLLEAGKAEPAAQSLSTVLGGGNLPPAIMAKALLYRGIAYRQQKKPAQAIADLTSALWLKGGLGENDRKDALRQRTSAYQEAGLSDSGEPVAPATPAPTRTASAAGAPDNGSPVQEGAPANPFSGWFGGSSSAPSSTPPPPQQQAPSTTASIESEPSQPVTAAPTRRAATSGWSRNTQVRGGGTAEPAVAVAAAARPEGKFRIQVGLARSQADAEALATKVKREHGAVLATRDPEIDETVVGNMGSFYRVRIGPFATAQEGQATCAKLKGPGIDCLVVTQ
jgi:cell division septation protein DedD